VIAHWSILAAENIAAQAAAPFTLGLSDIGAAACATRPPFYWRRLLKRPARRWSEAITETLKAGRLRLEAMIPTHRTWHDMNFGARRASTSPQRQGGSGNSGVDGAQELRPTFADRAGTARAPMRVTMPNGLDHAAGRGGDDGGGTWPAARTRPAVN